MSKLTQEQFQAYLKQIRALGMRKAMEKAV